VRLTYSVRKEPTRVRRH